MYRPEGRGPAAAGPPDTLTTEYPNVPFRIFPALAGLILFALPAVAGENNTTWRAGDEIAYTAGCHAPEHMETVLESASSEVWAQFVAEGKCFVATAMTPAGRQIAQIPAVLEEWLSGPFTAPSGAKGSLWRITDSQGDTEFVWWPDDHGPHEQAAGA